MSCSTAAEPMRNAPTNSVVKTRRSVAARAPMPNSTTPRVALPVTRIQRSEVRAVQVPTSRENASTGTNCAAPTNPTWVPLPASNVTTSRGNPNAVIWCADRAARSPSQRVRNAGSRSGGAVAR